MSQLKDREGYYTDQPPLENERVQIIGDGEFAGRVGTVRVSHEFGCRVLLDDDIEHKWRDFAFSELKPAPENDLITIVHSGRFRKLQDLETIEANDWMVSKLKKGVFPCNFTVGITVCDAQKRGRQQGDTWHFYRKKDVSEWSPEKITVGYTVQNAYDPNKDLETKPIQRKRVLYLAGPMRGRPYFNYQMFDRVRDWLLAEQRYEVISPADEDRKQDGFDPMVDPKYANPDNCVFPDSMDFPRVMRRCIDAVMRCDEIVMLPEWHTSAGAVAEFSLAVWAGKSVRFLYVGDDERIGFVRYPRCNPRDMAVMVSNLWGFNGDQRPQPEEDLDDDCGCSDCSSQDIRQSDDVLAEAFKITRGDRQATYGPPDQDFRRTAGMWTALFGHMLKEGEAFEPRHVAMAMIQLKCSREIHQRKRDNWVDMAGYASCGSRCN